MISAKFEPDRLEWQKLFHRNTNDFDWFRAKEISNNNDKKSGSVVQNIRWVMEQDLLVPLRIGILFNHATLLAFTAVRYPGSIFTAILLAPAEF
jgi:hypothetical protein